MSLDYACRLQNYICNSIHFPLDLVANSIQTLVYIVSENWHSIHMFFVLV